MKKELIQNIIIYTLPPLITSTLVITLTAFSGPDPWLKVGYVIITAWIIWFYSRPNWPRKWLVAFILTTGLALFNGIFLILLSSLELLIPSFDLPGIYTSFVDVDVNMFGVAVGHTLGTVFMILVGWVYSLLLTGVYFVVSKLVASRS